MHSKTLAAFADELEKIAFGASLPEVAGLGILAAHPIHTLANKKATKKEKTVAGLETAGLGTLAAHPAHAMWQAAKKGGWAAVKHASVKRAFSMANPFAFGRNAKQVAQVASSMKGAGKSVAKAAPKLERNIANFVPPTPTGKGWNAPRTWQNNPNAISL